MNRRDFLELVGLGAMSVVWPGCTDKNRVNPLTKPNIILFLVDDLGWKDLGCYGNKFYETPNIDKLAAQGLRFTDAYANCPVCSPSRAALLTGKYPARLQFTGHITAIGRHRHPEFSRIIPPDDCMYLPHEEITLAEALKPAGYVSANIGKWHIGDKNYWPEKQGFDINIGGWTHGSPPNYFFPYKNSNSQWNPSIPTLQGGKEGEYLTDRLTDEAIQFIQKNKTNPFFLYLSHYAVHTPLQAPPELVKKYNKKQKLSDVKQNSVYAAMIENLDQNFGRLMQELDRLKLSDNTIIIFFSDNGGELEATNNLPLRAGKGSLYEGGIRVPLIIKWPGCIQGNTVCEEPVIGTDLFPTIIQIASETVDPADNIDGSSLLPLFSNQQPLKRDAIYWYYPHYSPQAKQPGAAIRSGKFKLIEYYDPPEIELYDLSKDLSEQTNLVHKMPNKAASMQLKLHNFLKSVKAKMFTLNPNYKK